jgi:hypothetical protein
MSPQHRRIALGIALLCEAILGAIDQSMPRVRYWLGALFPMCIAGTYLWRSR